MKLLVLHGPSLDRLGTREPEIYGSLSLAGINALLEETAKQRGLELTILQSNHEGVLVDAILAAAENGNRGILMNPAAYSHTSVALLDAIRACGLPVVEVHLSNIHAREEFRRHSYTAMGAVGVVTGFGPDSYIAGLQLLAARLLQHAG
ncbi:MAG: type II 3-dehydroquinate dehydratase [bacterium]